MPESFFDAAYAKRGLVFGTTPTKRLHDFLDRFAHKGFALDLGCGEGRDTIMLLNRGFQVSALDASRVGIAKMLGRSDMTDEMRRRLKTFVQDIREWQWAERSFDLIIGTTILDHLNEDECAAVERGIIQTAKPGAIVFFEVHTIEDPGLTGFGPASEFAPQIHHYFAPNELLIHFQSHTRVLFYEEWTEWDYDHGEPHTHAFASLIGMVK